MIESFIQFVSGIQGHPGSIPLFILAYALACLGLPTSPFPVAAGFLFGFWPGFFLSEFCLTAGCSLGFMITRRWGMRVVRGFLKGRSPALFSKRPSALLMVVVRLTGIPPLPVTNYLAGLSGMSYSRFVVATAVGYIPWCLVTNYFSSVLWSALVEGGMRGIEKAIVAKAGPLLWSLAAFVAVILLATWLNGRSQSNRYSSSGS